MQSFSTSLDHSPLETISLDHNLDQQQCRGTQLWKVRQGTLAQVWVEQVKSQLRQQDKAWDPSKMQPVQV